jgi:hypothetical protein
MLVRQYVESLEPRARRELKDKLPRGQSLDKQLRVKINARAEDATSDTGLRAQMERSPAVVAVDLVESTLRDLATVPLLALDDLKSAHVEGFRRWQKEKPFRLD